MILIIAKIVTWIIVIFQVVGFFRWKGWRPIGIHRNGALLARVRFGLMSVLVFIMIAHLKESRCDKMDEEMLLACLLMLGNYTDTYMVRGWNYLKSILK